MLKREDVLSLSYLKKTSFTGSCQGVRFLLRREEPGDLQVFVWPEPYAFDHTPDEQKISCRVAFCEEGIMQAIDWINEKRSDLLSKTPGEQPSS